MNAIIPIRLKYKLYPVIVKSGSRENFVRLHDIPNYSDLPFSIPRKCHKKLAPKTVRHDKWESLVKMSLRDRSVCFADFVPKTLLSYSTHTALFRPLLHSMAVFCLLLLLPNWFLKVCSHALRSCLETFSCLPVFFRPITLWNGLSSCPFVKSFGL